MKVGEFFLKNNYVTQKNLDEALALQTHDKNLLLGEILVNMGLFSSETLHQYLIEYMRSTNNISREEAKRWLNQDDVDKLISKHTDVNKNK
ncbi:MAG: hypothetical protein MRJ65_08015 [Candidatus Brocadiaceae bacterium]|nr:hypothetical protein [Candidatus Brocadiaceae bacterium]